MLMNQLISDAQNGIFLYYNNWKNGFWNKFLLPVVAYVTGKLLTSLIFPYISYKKRIVITIAEACSEH